MIDPLYGVKCLKLGFDIYILDITAVRIKFQTHSLNN